MRAVTILIAVLLATGAGAAARRSATVDAAGLRGSVSAGDTGSSAPVASAPGTAAARLRKTASPAPPLASPLPAADSQCRMTCAHSYYRCLAGDYAEQCPQAWTLCLAGCARVSSGLR